MLNDLFIWYMYLNVAFAQPENVRLCSYKWWNNSRKPAFSFINYLFISNRLFQSLHWWCDPIYIRSDLQQCQSKNTSVLLKTMSLTESRSTGETRSFTDTPCQEDIQTLSKNHRWETKCQMGPTGTFTNTPTNGSQTSRSHTTNTLAVLDKYSQ